MVALKKYDRLEATGLWRESVDAQRKEVIVSVGDMSLVISDLQDRPLAHWSIAAVHRANPGAFPALFHPDGDPDETLELADSEHEMIAAIEKLRKAIHRASPHPGRLRGLAVVTSIAAVVAGAVFWLPDALRLHVTSVVPPLNRIVIGQDLMNQMTPFTGPTCSEPVADEALKRLARRVQVKEIYVVPGGVRGTASLPGGGVLLARDILEDHEDPAVAAGFVAAEALRAQTIDPLEQLLATGGFWASFRLLTTGQLTDETMRSHAERLSKQDPTPVDDQALIKHFESLNLAAAPYAYAQDISGESTLTLIEADAAAGSYDSVLSDHEWVALQEICTN